MLALIFLSYSVYFLELYANPRVNSLFDGAWFSFVSLATIGYGDIVLKLVQTKVITAVLAMCGFCVFTLPATIIGSALTLRLRDKRQRILCLRPATNLLQKMWRFYALHRITNYHKTLGLKNVMSHKQKYVLLFIFKVSFLLAQNRFKYANLIHSTGSVPLQYVQLQRKIELINTAVRKHKWDISSVYYQLKKIYADLAKFRSKTMKEKTTQEDKQ